MKYLALIQARCNSARLPGKVLKDLCGKPVLSRMAERVRKSRLLDEVIVITSISKSNLPVLSLCSGTGIRVGIGSEEDVLDRYYQTAKLLRPEYIVRLTADCPCFDAELLDDAITRLNPDTDYCAMISETYPDGLDFEIIKFSALEKSWKEAVHSYEREHVTQYILRHPDLFSLQDYVCPIGNLGSHRWTVDEPEDFELVFRIFQHFLYEENKEDFHYQDILRFLEQNPEIARINQHYRRNEGLQKSIAEDRIVIPGDSFYTPEE